MQSIVDLFGGNFRKDPEEIHEGRLSTGAAHMISELCSDLDFSKLIDHHVHIIGRGTGNSGCYIHPSYESVFYPKRYAKASIIQSAAGITSWQSADQQYVDRLVRLTKTFGPSPKQHGRSVILALDKSYTRDGRVNHDTTNFYVPNQYVYDISQSNQDLFIPGMSINPYRHDSVEELEKWANKGVKVCKWLPVAQGINMSDSECVPFYKKCAELGVALLVQTGKEVAVDNGVQPDLGNPLLIRTALEHGCTVVASHCGISGMFKDLDSPYEVAVDGFDLFLRLFNESHKFKGQLWGDLAGVALVNRLGLTTTRLISKQQIHHRLVYGSDYPLPAVNAVMSTRLLAAAGWISSTECNYLNEIYKFHPVLYDFATKRLMRGDEDIRFPASVFQNSYINP